MGSDAVLLSIILDWTFLKPLINRDDGRTVMDETPKQKQTVAEISIVPEIYY